MSLEEEKQLPLELRKKQLKFAGVRGWKFEDISPVLKACRELGLAVYGGHAQFCFPDAACEMYWKRFNPALKKSGESWPDYVSRSGSEFLRAIEELYRKTDFENEGIHSFTLLRDKKNTGAGILEHLCFRIDLVSENRYWVYFREFN